MRLLLRIISGVTRLFVEKPLLPAVSADVFLSLIVATINRTQELSLLLESLLTTSEPAFEVIIVDQNDDDRLSALLAAYAPRLPLTHLRFTEKNASKARNFGAQHARGQWIGFPDDDCCYTPDTIRQLTRAIDSSGCQIILGAVTDFDGTPLGNFRRRHSNVSLLTIDGKVNEPGVFMSRAYFLHLNGFNEEYGPGGRYFAAEAYELLVRALRNREKILFNADIQILHPNKLLASEQAVLRMGYTYAYGAGSMVARHFGAWSVPYLLRNLLLNVARLLLLDNRRKRYAVHCLKGLRDGFHHTITRV